MPKKFENCENSEFPASHRQNELSAHSPASPRSDRMDFATNHHSSIRDLIEQLDAGVLVEYRAKSVLKQFGISVPAGGLAKSQDEAIAIARDIGYPVVFKAQAVELPHKSDAGGVMLGIDSESALIESWTTLHKNIAVNMSGLVLEGILVERMGQKGVELIFGARNDPEWGPVLLAGFGGVLAEAIRDVRLMPPDLSIPEIAHELRNCNALHCCGAFVVHHPLTSTRQLRSSPDSGH